MTFEEFEASTRLTTPPVLSPALLALWYDARGDWNGAHEQVQAADSPEAAWVHAYLHRKEGDMGNAHYWYRRAGEPPQTGDLEMEWQSIATALLKRF